MILEKYSIGIGDRFGQQAKAQLRALLKALEMGIEIVPVWNKSHREHQIVKTQPQNVRSAADRAVEELEWKNSYYIDADHIGLKNVDLFLDSSDFFTLDVADFIGKGSDGADVMAFINKYGKYAEALSIPGIDEVYQIDQKQLQQIVEKYLPGVKEAGKIYRYIETKKGRDHFITEVSMDETDESQSPIEMFFILAAIAEEGIPAQTIAPKFTGRFNKGIDYIGNLDQFTQEFKNDLAVICYAIQEFGLPENLKLSIHSGSDKFSIYKPIRNAIKEFDVGLHIKTAGTTWLEELIGLAAAGSESLQLAKEIYHEALKRFDELCGPYKTVIDIDKTRLPKVSEVDQWDGHEFVNALRHDPSCKAYNPHFRQLFHVGYKIAAEMGETYLQALNQNEEVIAEHVTENIYLRHIKPLFID